MLMVTGRDIRIRIENVKLEIRKFENFIRNLKILLEILSKRKINFFFSSGSKLPSREVRSRVNDHYHHRPGRFFGFKIGNKIKAYLKFFRLFWSKILVGRKF